MLKKQFKKRALTLAFLLAAGFLSGETLYVQVKETALRDKPSAIGKVLGSVAYASSLTVVQKSGGFIQVTVDATKAQGWISASAVSNKAVAKSAGTDSGGASSNEVALAGKGFNDQVEQQYKADNHIDYSWVDKMEAITVPSDQLDAFDAAKPQGGAK